jgi:putative glycosyltransferase
MMVQLSIVSTLYRSSPYIVEFHDRISRAARAIGGDYEIVFVNDGSPDDVLQRALALQRSDDHIRIVDLSRNFGHHHAVIAGHTEARGERIFLIDVDLEERPEWLPEFWERLDATGADVVYGVQQARGGSFVNRYLAGSFYSLFNALSDTKIPPNLCTVRLMTSAYVRALLELRDRNLFLAGNCAWAGFDQQAITVQKTVRPGPSNYNLGRMFRLFFDAVSSFSSYPLRAIFVTGLVIATLSGMVGLEMIVRKIREPDSVVLGFSSIIVSLWFLGGLMIFFLGVIGLYLSKVFVEVKDRPRFIVRKVYERAAQPSSKPLEKAVVPDIPRVETTKR